MSTSQLSRLIHSNTIFTGKLEMRNMSSSVRLWNKEWWTHEQYLNATPFDKLCVAFDTSPAKLARRFKMPVSKLSEIVAKAYPLIGQSVERAACLRFAQQHSSTGFWQMLIACYDTDQAYKNYACYGRSIATQAYRWIVLSHLLFSAAMLQTK